MRRQIYGKKVIYFVRDLRYDEFSSHCIVTCRGVTIRRGLDRIFGFIALVYTTRNYTLQITDTHRLVPSAYYSLQ
jgi:hypothetical protein